MLELMVSLGVGMVVISGLLFFWIEAMETLGAMGDRGSLWVRAQVVADQIGIDLRDARASLRVFQTASEVRPPLLGASDFLLRFDGGRNARKAQDGEKCAMHGFPSPEENDTTLYARWRRVLTARR